MNVLGWTRDSTTPPCGISTHHVGGWAVLLSHPSASITARERLAMQVRCFDRGVDFLPTAPAQEIKLHDAGNLPSNVDLDALWQKLQGQGQFAISVVTQNDKHPSPDGGREWLRTRKARRDRHRDCERLLHDITERLNLPTVQHCGVRCAARRDVLAPRARADEIWTSIKGIAQSIDAPPDISLSVTGLWPPFGFVRRAEESEVAA